MIAIDDRISDVLARDERLVDVFMEFSPHFAKLRNPKLRRVMGRLVTVRQAAGIAGVDPDELLSALNRETEVREMRDVKKVPAVTESAESAESAADAGTDPFLARVDPSSIIDLDVREDLRAGREPFGRIMAAVGAMRNSEVLRLRAIFEPVPLYAVLEKRGLTHWTEQLAPDDWRVWFFDSALSGEGAVSPRVEENAAPSEEVTPDAAASFDHDEPPVVLRLDVRGLEPPEPMVRTLAALEDLPPNGVLVQTNVRVPRFLIEELDRRGFRHEVQVVSNDEVEVTIRRAS